MKYELGRNMKYELGRNMFTELGRNICGNEINNLRNKMPPTYISNVIDDCPLHNSLMQFTKGHKGGISVQLQKTFGNFDLISSFFLKD